MAPGSDSRGTKGIEACRLLSVGCMIGCERIESGVGFAVEATAEPKLRIHWTAVVDTSEDSVERPSHFDRSLASPSDWLSGSAKFAEWFFVGRVRMNGTSRCRWGRMGRCCGEERQAFVVGKMSMAALRWWARSGARSGARTTGVETTQDQDGRREGVGKRRRERRKWVVSLVGVENNYTDGKVSGETH